MMVGFTPEAPGAYYAGELLIRELTQHPDGTLGTKWPEEMIPTTGPPLELPFRASVGNARLEGNSMTLSAPDGIALGAFGKVPQDARITMRVRPKAGARRFGLSVRAEGDNVSGCELRFEPALERARFVPATGGSATVEADDWMAIEGVSGLDAPFTLDVIVKNDLVDACIDNRRTIIARNRTKLHGDRLCFTADHGEVTFDEIQVRPLMDGPVVLSHSIAAGPR
jgi:hypothetical protein